MNKVEKIAYNPYLYNKCCYYGLYTGWAKKSKPDIFCNNVVYCWPISIIFGTYTL